MKFSKIGHILASLYYVSLKMSSQWDGEIQWETNSDDCGAHHLISLPVIYGIINFSLKMASSYVTR